ncbi:MAG: hypothetical protein H7X91_03725 [Burkholderiales bacterium]|nr:hypothetical protein [Burkholderiales bacterium]
MFTGYATHITMRSGQFADTSTNRLALQSRLDAIPRITTTRNATPLKSAKGEQMKSLSAWKTLGALLLSLVSIAAQAAPNAYVVNVLDGATGSVTVIDTADNSVVITVPIPATATAVSGPQEIVINRTSTRAYIANFLDDTVEVLQLSDNTFLAEIALPGSGSPIDLAFRPNTDLLYVVRQSGDVVVVDTAAGTTGTVLGSPIVTTFQGTQAIVFNGSGSRAYVANLGSARVSAIAADANPPALVPAPNNAIVTGDQPTDVEYDAVANRLFVTNAGDDNISIFNINPTTDAATADGPPLALGGQPLGVRLTPDRSRIFVSFPFGNGIASFANTSPFGGPFVSTPTGTRPQYFNFRLSDSRLYVTNGGTSGNTANDSISVFDIAGATATPIANNPFPVRNNPKYVAIADGSPGPAPAAGTLQFDPAAVTVAENVAGGVVTLTVTRTGGSTGAVSATVTPTPGSAASGSDFTATATPATISFVDGDATAKTVTVPINNDSTDDDNESFTVTLSAPTGGAVLGADTATVTIMDDDPAPGGGGTPAPAPAGDGGGGGGGGGCTLNADRAADYGLPLLLLSAGLFYAFRRRIGK